MESPRSLGDIIHQTGDIGRFQIATILVLSFGFFSLNWSLMIMVFAGAIPDWTCQMQTNQTSSDAFHKKCVINGTECPKHVFTDDMHTVVSQWDLVCDKKWITQTITTIQMSGSLVGGFFWGHLSDAVGRKWSFIIALILISVCNFVSYFSVAWEMFAALNFLIGFACVGALMAGATIELEIVRDKWRLIVSMLPCWELGAGGFALFCWLVHDWRYIHIANVCGASVLILAGWLILPESFRWLLSQGRIDEAEEIIKRMARMNGKPVPKLETVRCVLMKEVEDSAKAKTLGVYTMIDLFKDGRLARRTLIFGFIWFSTGFAYYGIAFGVQELSGNFYLNLFLVGIIGIPGDFLIYVFNRWGGRRWTSVGFYVIAGVTAVAVGVMQKLNLDYPGLINGFALTSKLFVGAVWSLVMLWTTESFPTVVRNISHGAINSISRTGPIIAPQIVSLSTDIPGLLYLVCGGLTLCSALACATLAETKGKDLTDVLPVRRSGYTTLQEENVIGENKSVNSGNVINS